MLKSQVFQKKNPDSELSSSDFLRNVSNLFFNLKIIIYIFTAFIVNEINDKLIEKNFIQIRRTCM